MDDVLGRNLLINAGSNVMYKRKVLFELNGFDETFRRSQDLEILVRFFDMKYELKHIPYEDLVVMMDCRDSSLTEVYNLPKLFESLDYYNDKFQYIYDGLDEEIKKKVTILRNLEKLKVCLLNKDLNNTIKLLKSISPIITVRYLYYLLQRKKNNQIKRFVF